MKKFYDFTLKIFAPLRLCAFAGILFFTTYAQTLAPGAPGNDAQWSTAGKQAIGTSASFDSKVWFTLADGALTEVYYPDVTVANVHLLQFVVVDSGSGKTETEQADSAHEIKVLRNDALSFQQINTAKSGNWKITKTYTTDNERNTILIDVKIETFKNYLNFYVYYDPSLNNTGMHDTGWTQNGALLSKDGEIASALSKTEKILPKTKFEEEKPFDGFFRTNNGFLGTTGGTDLFERQFESSMRAPNAYRFQYFERAENGNITQTGSISLTRIIGGTQIENLKNKEFTLALGFGKTPEIALKNSKDSLQKGFQKSQAEYEKGWSDYIKTLPKVEAKYQAQFNMAAMVLKAQEDKTVRGANVASLTVPWGGGKNANEDVGGGYHLVWSRDLYQVFTAYLALGDTAAANRALDFLFNIQQKPDGSFPQNSWLDGRNGWGGLQMDEVGYPLIMAYQLKRFDKQTYENHVKKAADFLVKNGPRTPQERWEEKGGYSPSTIAAEIAGLVCAAEIARKNNDETSANLYLKTADDWTVNIEKWTATTNGKFGDGNYYVRLTANGKPDAGEKIELSNSSGAFLENEIVDAGFLELVRLGIKSPDDPLIVKSLKVIDAQIKVNTPNGESFYRYNHDGYGEQPDGRRWNFDGTYSGTGRLWALLAGERGQYELARQNFYLDQINYRPPFDKVDNNSKKYPPVKPSIEFLISAKKRLDAMANFANEGLMIPEQIWDKAETPTNIDRQFIPELKFGEGTGSATPLAWSMAQFIRLAVNLQASKNLDTPDVVYNRYVLGINKEKTRATADCNFNISKTISTDSLKVESVKTDKSPVVCAENKVLFVYIGEAKNVEVVGDFTSWQPKNLAFKDQYLGIKTFEMSFAPTARVEYKLIVDGKWITDPLNPNKVDNGVGGENSVLTMPDYKPTEWNNAVGQTKYGINIEKINSKIYGEREIQVYVPEGYEKQPLPVMYLQDGTDYQKRADAVFIQRNLVKANKIKPFIMVFLDPKERMKEYWANDDYAKFLATEVVPAIDAKYKTIKSRDGRAVLGASLGGITSVWVGIKYPEIFSKIGGQSSSFWIDDRRVVKELEKLDASKTKFKFYFDDGTLEGVEDSRKVVKILKDKGFEITYVEGEAGHNWTAWRDRLENAFVAFAN